jgi:hypothetical protein
MDVIVVQSEGAVKFLSLKLVFLEALVRADVTYHTTVGIVVGNLFDNAVSDYHAVVPHIVTNVKMPSVDGIIAE